MIVLISHFLRKKVAIARKKVAIARKKVVIDILKPA